MTKKAKVIGKKVQVTQPPTASQLLDPIKLKFQRLKQLRGQIANLKHLYKEHDAVMQELLPLFIKVEADRFVIAREISLGTEKFRFTPYFYDAKDGLKAKVWKSTAFEAGAIE